MKGKTERPLNKAEQKLFARLYTASLIHHSAMHLVAASEAEEDGIQKAIDELVDKLLGGHESQSATSQIVQYIKGLRR